MAHRITDEACFAADPSGEGYRCTRPKGHIGEHIAHNERDQVMSRWPRLRAPVDPPERCETCEGTGKVRNNDIVAIHCSACGARVPFGTVHKCFERVSEASALRDPDLWQVQVEGDEEVDAYCTEAEAEVAAVETRRELIEEYAETGSRHLVPEVHVYPVWVGSPLRETAAVQP